MGLKWTFIIMLVPLAASAGVLFWAAKHYPTDVATAGLVTARGPARYRPRSQAQEPPKSKRHKPKGVRPMGRRLNVPGLYCQNLK